MIQTYVYKPNVIKAIKIEEVYSDDFMRELKSFNKNIKCDVEAVELNVELVKLVYLYTMYGKLKGVPGDYVVIDKRGDVDILSAKNFEKVTIKVNDGSSLADQLLRYWI